MRVNWLRRARARSLSQFRSSSPSPPRRRAPSALEHRTHTTTTSSDLLPASRHPSRAGAGGEDPQPRPAPRRFRFRERLAGVPRRPVSALCTRQAPGRIVSPAVYLMGRRRRRRRFSPRGRAPARSTSPASPPSRSPGFGSAPAVSAFAPESATRAKVRYPLGNLAETLEHQPLSRECNTHSPTAVARDNRGLTRQEYSTTSPPRVALDRVGFTYPGADSVRARQSTRRSRWRAGQSWLSSATTGPARPRSPSCSHSSTLQARDIP